MSTLRSSTTILSLSNELLQQICDCLTPQNNLKKNFSLGDSPETCRSNLVNVGLTCKSLTPFALRSMQSFILWDVQQNRWNRAGQFERLQLLTDRYKSNRAVANRVQCIVVLLDLSLIYPDSDFLEPNGPTGWSTKGAKLRQDVGRSMCNLNTLLSKTSRLKCLFLKEALFKDPPATSGLERVALQLPNLTNLRTLHLTQKGLISQPRLINENLFSIVLKIPTLHYLRLSDGPFLPAGYDEFPQGYSNVKHLVLEGDIFGDGVESDLVPLLRAFAGLVTYSRSQRRDGQRFLLGMADFASNNCNSLVSLKLDIPATWRQQPPVARFWCDKSKSANTCVIADLNRLEELDISFTELLYSHRYDNDDEDDDDASMLSLILLPESLRAIRIRFVDQHGINAKRAFALDIVDTWFDQELADGWIEVFMEPEYTSLSILDHYTTKAWVYIPGNVLPLLRHVELVYPPRAYQRLPSVTLQGPFGPVQVHHIKDSLELAGIRGELPFDLFYPCFRFHDDTLLRSPAHMLLDPEHATRCFFEDL